MPPVASEASTVTTTSSLWLRWEVALYDLLCITHGAALKPIINVKPRALAELPGGRSLARAGSYRCGDLHRRLLGNDGFTGWWVRGAHARKEASLEHTSAIGH
jgi:hypothetical protein